MKWKRQHGLYLLLPPVGVYAFKVSSAFKDLPHQSSLSACFLAESCQHVFPIVADWLPQASVLVLEIVHWYNHDFFPQIYSHIFIGQLKSRAPLTWWLVRFCSSILCSLCPQFILENAHTIKLPKICVSLITCQTHCFVRFQRGNEN